MTVLDKLTEPVYPKFFGFCVFSKVELWCTYCLHSHLNVLKHSDPIIPTSSLNKLLSSLL